MSSSTGVGQRLYILLSILVALAPIIGYFIILGAENNLREVIEKGCRGNNDSLWLFCFRKAYEEGNLAFWQYLLPFVPAVSVACGKWVLGTPRPVFPFSRFSLYLVFEVLLVLASSLFVLFSIYSVAVDPLQNWAMRRVLKAFYVLVVLISAPFILSKLLDRAPAERWYKVLRYGVYVVLLMPILSAAIIIFRQISGVQ